MESHKSDDIKKRIFIVGIARSGTTLLQSMLGSHPDIYTMPEMHFWDRSIFKQRILRALQIIGKNKIGIVSDQLNELDKDFQLGKLPSFFYSKVNWTQWISEQLDKISLRNGKQNWLEKTPLNLHYIDLLDRSIPNSCFIHIVRKPLDNIASLYQASKEHPDYFMHNTIEKCIQRYKTEIGLSQQWLAHQNHFFVRYEDITDDPEPVLKNMCLFYSSCLIILASLFLL